MKNLDVLEMQKRQIVQKMNEAAAKGDADAFQEAFLELSDHIQERVLQEARGLIEAADRKVLSDRGVRQLTSRELDYYQKLTEAMKSQDAGDDH